jgi:hypothetical protein
MLARTDGERVRMRARIWRADCDGNGKDVWHGRVFNRGKGDTCVTACDGGKGRESAGWWSRVEGWEA